MHKAALDFVKEFRQFFPDSFKNKRVLEVGSRYINGTVRTLFEGCHYTGLDLSSGPLVDFVCHVADYEGEPFDTIISCEALEHDKRWAESLKAMYRLLKPGGALIITAAGTGRPEHGTLRTSPSDSPATTDYYGNISKEMFWMYFDPWSKKHWKNFFINDVDGDFRFWGIKA